jgi:hypothetical protein
MRQNCTVEVTCNKSRSTSLHENGNPSIFIDQYTGNTKILLASVLAIFTFYWPACWKYPYLVGQCTEIFGEVSILYQHKHT